MDRRAPKCRQRVATQCRHRGGAGSMGAVVRSRREVRTGSRTTAHHRRPCRLSRYCKRHARRESRPLRAGRWPRGPVLDSAASRRPDHAARSRNRDPARPCPSRRPAAVPIDVARPGATRLSQGFLRPRDRATGPRAGHRACLPDPRPGGRARPPLRGHDRRRAAADAAVFLWRRLHDRQHRHARSGLSDARARHALPRGVGRLSTRTRASLRHSRRRCPRRAALARRTCRRARGRPGAPRDRRRQRGRHAGRGHGDPCARRRHRLRPATAALSGHEARRRHAVTEGYLLDATTIAWFFDQYVPHRADRDAHRDLADMLRSAFAGPATSSPLNDRTLEKTS